MIKPHVIAATGALLAGISLVTGAEPTAPQDLDSVTVEGQRLPWDSRRPEYDRMLPCIGCDGRETGEPMDVVSAILHYVILPSEPVDQRAFTPISLQQPRNPRADKLP